MKKITRKTKLDALYVAQAWSLDYWLCSEVSVYEVQRLLKVSKAATDLVGRLWDDVMKSRYPEKYKALNWTPEEFMQAHADVALQLQKELDPTRHRDANQAHPTVTGRSRSTT
jgi:hypothetical protein